MDRSELGAIAVASELAHFGVKGMKWGVRKDRFSKAEKKSPIVKVKHKPGERVRTAGGSKLPAHQDAVKAAVAKRRASSSTTDALSDQELKKLVNRMNLEKQYKELTTKQKEVSRGQKFVDGVLQRAGDRQLQKVEKFADRRIEGVIKSAAGNTPFGSKKSPKAPKVRKEKVRFGFG